MIFLKFKLTKKYFLVNDNATQLAIRINSNIDYASHHQSLDSLQAYKQLKDN